MGDQLNANNHVLVATERVADAALVMEQLSEEYDHVIVSADPKRAVQDFEKHRPAVLILAFDSLEKAERYYLGLYRLSTIIHTLPHRTLILCNKDDLRRVYDLCKKEYFDDYILFWPAWNDALRLPMAVHHALHQMSLAAADAPSAREFAAQARQLAVLESVLKQHTAAGGQGMDVASQSLKQAEREIGAALDGDRSKVQEVLKHVQSAAAAVQPVRQSLAALTGNLAPQLESARALQSLAKRVRPVVLVVDDDDFQRKLMARLLADANVEQAFASSGTEALASLRKRRPDLVLMDLDLPDIDGVETTRRMKSIESLAAVPVIMITGSSGKEVVVQSLKAGAADFVVKPVDRSILLAKVRKLLSVGATEAV